MKFIVKGREPARLLKWRLAQKPTPQNLRFQNIPGKALDQIRATLLEEQGYLCAYTMLRIAAPTKGHIEHIVPQSADKDLQVDYANMVYCYPGDGDRRCVFGAHGKGGFVVSSNNFVSPLDPKCEARFTYRDDGAIAEAHSGDTSAKNAIAILRLDHATLTRARVTAIRNLPIFDPTKPRVSASRARKMASEVIGKDNAGRFREFAVALSQVMSRYARRRAAKEAAMGAR